MKRKHMVCVVTVPMLMLDLFCGLGGASQAFDVHEDWTVIRVDNEPLLEQYVPGICIEDILDDKSQGRWWQPHMKVHLLWASPPCREFSNARTPKIEKPDMTLILKTIELIERIKPQVWIIENVVGAIKHFQPLLGPPRLIIGPYCFWGNFPLFHVELGEHTKYLFEGKEPWSDDPLRPQKRAYVPLGISQALLEALKHQTTLAVWFPIQD